MQFTNKKNNRKKISLLLYSVTLFFLILSLSQLIHASDNGFVMFGVSPLHVTIGSNGDVTLPEISPSFDTGEIQGTFSPDSFRLDDRKSSDSGYITTIQASNLVFNNGTEDIILSRDNIYFKTNPYPSVLYGLSNPRVDFGSSIKDVRGNIGKPVVYFKRNPGFNSGIIGRYGDTPSIKIIIPPAQAPGLYTGTIYFTLISG